MNLKKTNINYCATIAKIDKIVKLDNCDNVVSALVMGYSVIVDKTYQEGQLGVFFPVETQLSHDYLVYNNLYKDNTLNLDINKKGYFELNRRIRCQKFRGNKSEGLFMPLDSLYDICGFEINSFKCGDEFNEIDGIKICEKYIIPSQRQSNGQNIQKAKGPKRKSRIIDNQFRFHIDTAQLKKNIHRINPNDLISITNKMHGSSCIVSNILVKKNLNILEKMLKFVGVNIVDTEYDYVYSSRTVIKNKWMDKKQNHYYKEDLWGAVCEEVKSVIPKGFTLYGEIVGYTQGGGAIQKNSYGPYDYGCEQGKHAFYVYRITFTNQDGKVFELIRPQIEDFCKQNGLNVTPLFFFGYAKDAFPEVKIDDNWQQNFLENLEKSYNLNNAKCTICKSNVPAEGCVVRKEKLYDCEPFKIKNYDFLQAESKQLDTGEIDIESQESVGDSENLVQENG